MDKIEPGKDVNEDVTRESLIAISYGVPDNDDPNAAEISPKNTDSNEKVVERLIRDGLEIYRSKLISISYFSPPDVNVFSPSPGQLDG